METNNENIEDELSRFNWGAAFWGVIWSIVNKCFRIWFISSLLLCVITVLAGLFIVYIINKISYDFSSNIYIGFSLIVLFTVIAVFVYTGKHANRWAWEKSQQEDLDNFIQTQRTWAIFAVIFMLIGIVLFGLNLKRVSKFLSAEKISNLNQSNISKNSCNIMSEIIPDVIMKAKEGENWVGSLADEIDKNKQISYCFGNNYTGKLDISIGDVGVSLPERVEFTVIREKPCTISEANCYIFAPVSDKDLSCRFYFDDDGKVVPSQKTVKFIGE